MKFNIRITKQIPVNAYIPYRNTIFRGWIMYLLNNIFSTIRATDVNMNDAINRIIPIICSVVEWIAWELSSFDSKTSNIWTNVMPIKARVHPSIDDFVKFLRKHSLENIAVAIIVPPLDICQTEPDIKFSEMYAKTEASKSIKPGTNGM